MKKRVRFLGVSDWRAVVLCFIAASTFWFLNAMNEDYTSNISYPVRFYFQKDKFVPVNDLPKTIRFNATGYGWDFLRRSLWLNIKPVELALNNPPEKGYLTASELLPILSRQIHDLRVNYLIKDTLYFSFEKLVTKKVVLVADTTKVIPEKPYRFKGPIIFDPDTVQIAGPHTTIETFPDTVRIALPFKNLRSDVNEVINIEKSFPAPLQVNHKKIKVKAEIASFHSEDKSIALNLINFPADSSIVPQDNKVIITYIISEEDRSKVSASDFILQLDYRKMDRSDSVVKPQLIKKPDFIKEYYLSPSVIRINHVRH